MKQDEPRQLQTRSIHHSAFIILPFPHPHVHCVVPGGRLSADHRRWVRPKHRDYFLPQTALAARFRNRLKQVLQREHPQLFVQIPRRVWSVNWVADVQPVGSGEPALKYLAAYVYRTAWSAEKIVADDARGVTFRYRNNTGHDRTLTLPAEKFLHRFLQHVLPKGQGPATRALLRLVEPGGQSPLRAHPRFARRAGPAAPTGATRARARMSLLP